jgi:hypothetical protein
MYRVSTRVLDYGKVRGSIDQHLEEIEVDRATEKTVWVRGHRSARYTEHQAYTESVLGALNWLRTAWERRSKEYEKQIGFYGQQIVIYRELTEKANAMASLTEAAIINALPESPSTFNA